MIGLDTETQDGKAILVCTPTRALGCPSGLSIWDILDFLFFEDPYICYNLTFDAQAIFSLLPSRCQWELARLNKTVLGRYVCFDWIPGKRLMIHHVLSNEKIFLYDCYQHYNMSLAKASEKFLGESKTGDNLDKTHMRRELRKRRAEVVAYCQRDALLCQRLWEKIDTSLTALNVSTDNPISGANLAARALFPKGYRPPFKRQDLIFRRGYAGARNETFQRGTFHNVWKYDIHSAYPYQAAQLQNFKGLIFRTGDVVAKNAAYGLYHVRVRIPERHPFGMVPVRMSTLIFPVGSFETFLTRIEYEAFEPYIEKVYQCWQWVGTAEKQFPRIPELYALREKPHLKLAVKLLLNGLYGKTCQENANWVECPEEQADIVEQGRFFRREVKPGYYQTWVYASAITAGTRVQLYRAMQQNPESIIMVATDGIWSTKKLNLPVSPNMGDWSCEKVKTLTVVGCGIYQEDEKTKFRGFHCNTDLRKELKKSYRKKEILLNVGIPHSMLWALKNNRPINEIAQWEKVQSLNSDTKRQWPTEATGKILLETNQSSNALIYYGGYKNGTAQERKD